jgi:hypothetical protein
MKEVDDHANSNTNFEQRLMALEHQLTSFASSIESLRGVASHYVYAESRNAVHDMHQHHSLGSNLHSLPSFVDTKPKLERSGTDLDRGRFIVGLDVREVLSHQQDVVDYSSYGSKPNIQPIRIRYMLPITAALESKQWAILSTLHGTSFIASADECMHALKVTPVPERLFPSVKTCGGAKVPQSDRSNGIDDADIVIYISSDEKFFRGALMHSAVCDFDQVCWTSTEYSVFSQ